MGGPNLAARLLEAIAYLPIAYIIVSVFLHFFIYIYICRLTMARQQQGTYLPDGPYSVHAGVCNTFQCRWGILVSGGWCEACWAAHVSCLMTCETCCMQAQIKCGDICTNAIKLSRC